MAKWFRLLVVAASLIACEREEGQVSRELPTVKSSGFVHYDWLPKQLKHTMDHLLHLHPDRHFNFYYYFPVDDINRHYYMVDAGLEVIAEMPVTNQEVLRFIDNKLYELPLRKRGIYTAIDTNQWADHTREQLFHPEKYVIYVLTEDSVDFTQLRIAIAEDTTRGKRWLPGVPGDTVVYTSSEVDQPAEPMRGADYFRQAILKETASSEAFILYDTGTVEVTFQVWGGRARSPNLVRGLSTHYDTHEAYQADGEFIKAINDAKVWWHDARQNGRPVASTVRMTFDISQLKKSLP